jgi:3-phenylpropionate/cinnamic acid dioxygenase small subunit
MADRKAINDLFADYAWAMDDRDFDLLAQVFHDDASFVIYIEGADPVGPISPGSGVVEFISSTTQQQTDQRRHVITNVRFEEETDSDAKVTATLTLIVIDNGQLTVQSTGVYTAECVNSGSRWQFREFALALDLPF